MFPLIPAHEFSGNWDPYFDLETVERAQDYYAEHLTHAADRVELEAFRIFWLLDHRSVTDNGWPQEGRVAIHLVLSTKPEPTDGIEPDDMLRALKHVAGAFGFLISACTPALQHEIPDDRVPVIDHVFFDERDTHPDHDSIEYISGTFKKDHLNTPVTGDDPSLIGASYVLDNSPLEVRHWNSSCERVHTNPDPAHMISLFANLLEQQSRHLCDMLLDAPVNPLIATVWPTYPTVTVIDTHAHNHLAFRIACCTVGQAMIIHAAYSTGDLLQAIRQPALANTADQSVPFRPYMRGPAQCLMYKLSQLLRQLPRRNQRNVSWIMRKRKMPQRILRPQWPGLPQQTPQGRKRKMPSWTPLPPIARAAHQQHARRPPGAEGRNPPPRRRPDPQMDDERFRARQRRDEYHRLRDLASRALINRTLADYDETAREAKVKQAYRRRRGRAACHRADNRGAASDPDTEDYAPPLARHHHGVVAAERHLPLRGDGPRVPLNPPRNQDALNIPGDLWNDAERCPGQALWTTQDLQGYLRASTAGEASVATFWATWEQRNAALLDPLPIATRRVLVARTVNRVRFSLKRFILAFLILLFCLVVPTIATHSSPLPVNMHPPSCTSAPLIDPTAKVLHDEPSMEAGPSTDPGHPPWTVDAYVPEGAPDVISDGKVFKADQGWTICDHHPLMIHADVTRLHEMLLQHVTCFASKLSDLQPGYSGPEGPFTLTPPGVEMQVPASSKLRQPRRRSPIEEQVMDEHNQPLADAGFIEPAHRAVLSHESVIVVKKNPDTGEWTDKRCCHNYSEASGGINGYTPTDPYQLPLPEDLFRRTEGSKFFSVIDMKSGFMQTHMDKSVRHLCAFWWKKQLWQPTRNNFGLKNMPA
ncbi:hypothetical protein CEUSTIGMA_g13882.t1, partial [Chlamydomonas eustigma]